MPKGLTLFINDILVGDQYKKDDSGKNSSYDVYEIPYLFNGTTILKATSDFTEDYKKKFIHHMMITQHQSVHMILSSQKIRLVVLRIRLRKMLQSSLMQHRRRMIFQL